RPLRAGRRRAGAAMSTSAGTRPCARSPTRSGRASRRSATCDRTRTPAAWALRMARRGTFCRMSGPMALVGGGEFDPACTFDAAWDDGAVLAGSSAGAMVLCDPMVDPRGGAFTLGLALVAQLAVIPHHDHWSEEKARRTIDLAPEGLPIVGIDERTALLRDPD